MRGEEEGCRVKIVRERKLKRNRGKIKAGTKQKKIKKRKEMRQREKLPKEPSKVSKWR